MLRPASKHFDWIIGEAQTPSLLYLAERETENEKRERDGKKKRACVTDEKEIFGRFCEQCYERDRTSLTLCTCETNFLFLPHHNLNNVKVFCSALLFFFCCEKVTKICSCFFNGRIVLFLRHTVIIFCMSLRSQDGLKKICHLFNKTQSVSQILN